MSEKTIAICGECGYSVKCGDRYCSQCGLNLYNPSRKHKDEIIALILSVKKEMYKATHAISNALGATQTWGLELAIVDLNEVHRWVSDDDELDF